MTGPGPGKILIEDTSCRIICRRKEIPLEDVKVYIHLKGYSYARVTHLDIEHPLLNEIIKDGEGGYYKIYNLSDKLRIVISPSKRLVFGDYICDVYYIEIASGVFVSLLGKKKYTVTWVGGKVGGIYIGFRREQIRRLETIAREKYGF